MAKPRRSIEIGKEYGQLTVLGEAPKDPTGHIRWNVRCRCGSEHMVQTGFLSKPNCKCKKCSDINRSARPRLSKIGDVLNGMQILSEVGKNEHGAILYECRCLKCGAISIKTRGALSVRIGNGCVNCPPNYHFQICDGVATGTLPDGTVFYIDANMVEKVSKEYWHYSTKGYIISNARNRPKQSLHRFVLGIAASDNSTIVDHINRSKLDCRSQNLRVVTAQQNSMNRSIQSNNTTGYVGVTFSNRAKKYIAKIGLNDRDIYLGQSTDPILCAQMYNIASELLFKGFVGHVNDVPVPDLSTVKRVKEKLTPYITQAIIATTPCEISLSA